MMQSSPGFVLLVVLFADNLPQMCLVLIIPAINCLNKLHEQVTKSLITFCVVLYCNVHLR